MSIQDPQIPGWTVGDVLRRKHQTEEPIKKVMWLGPRPTQCNACEGQFLKGTVAFVDGWIRGGGWGIYHLSCFKNHGGKLGTGRGQKYDMKTLEKIDG